MLIHEVYNTKGFKNIKNQKWQTYHSNFHTSAYDLAKITTAAKPGLLILYHQLWMGEPEDDLLKEIHQCSRAEINPGLGEMTKVH